MLKRYMQAWEDADMQAVAALLKDDAVLTMPPAPSWYRGSASIVAFVSSFVFADPTQRLRLIATRANRQPACAAYVWDAAAGRFSAYGIMVVRSEGEAIAEITGFADRDLFRIFGLPETLTAAPSSRIIGGMSRSGRRLRRTREGADTGADARRTMR